uniref:Lipase_3 domain-containing protein n=1 Tax=Macrostomum lignano TaxID=282301 RepID=A0A1I8HND8_9PLAT
MLTQSYLLQETYVGSNEPTEYVLTNQKLVTKSKKLKLDSLVSTAKDVFLPQGYPDSVSADYLTYQIWDTAQAFCSSLTSALASRAVLTGYGVGDQGASVAAATLAWLLRDGCGMVGRILFAWLYGTALDWDCKRYRLLADVLNDLAILIQLLCPLAGPPGSPAVVAVLCIASVTLALVTVCGGATRAACVYYAPGARQHNMADVSAKDASQETLVNLVELVVNLTFVPLITGPVAVPVFIIFTSVAAAPALGVAEVNQSEPLLRSCAAPLRLGCPLSAPAAALPADRLVDGLRQQRHRRLAVFTGASSYYAVLAEDATSTDQLLAVFQCELIHLARTRPKLFDAIGGCSELRAGDAAAAATAERLMPDFLGALSKAGWSTEPLLLGAGQHRLTWSNEATEYVLTQQKLLIKGKKRKFDGFVSTAKDVFLPQGYPDSVSADYLTYQMWDTAQAFCSSVTGALAGRAVLTGYGVGDQGASVAAATLAWLLRDGCGMVGRILFAWLYGTALDWDCKRYRLLADVLNDLAILMQLLCPLAGPPGSPTVAAVLCVASVLLSLVGVCGGATRAALTMHQARRHNMADVSAKDSSQETLVNLFALLFNLAFVPLITGGAAVLAYLLFTFGHLYFNWRAVRSVAMETLNPSRLHLVVVSFVASGGRACSGVAEVNQSEPLLRSCAAPLRLGCPLSAPAAALPADRLVDGLRQQRHRRLAVFTGASSYYVVLAEDATSADQLLAVFQCELIHLARTRPKLFDAVGGCSELRAGDAAAAATAERLMPDFLGALSKAGWSTEPLLLGAGQHRLVWSKSA